MGRTWHLLAIAGLFGVVGCGEPAADAVEGGEGVTVETGAPTEGAPATEAPGELPPNLDVIPTNE